MITKLNQKCTAILIISLAVLICLTVWSLLDRHTSKPSEKQLVLKSFENETIVAIDTIRKGAFRKDQSGHEPIFKLIPPPTSPFDFDYDQNGGPIDDEPNTFTLVDQEPKIINYEKFLLKIQSNYYVSDCANLLKEKVILRVLVGADGSYVKSVVVRSSSACAAKAMQNALPALKFTPAYRNKIPVRVWVTLPLPLD